MDNPMMNAILRWSVSQGGMDTTQPSEAKPMDAEKKAFLEKVMSEMVEDESKSMKDIVEAIKGPEETLEQANAKQRALEDAIDRCDRIDYAVAFHSFANGLFPTIDLLESSEHGAIRAHAAELIALVVKDNPPCQAWAFEGKALERLLALHRGHVKSGEVVGQLERLRAVSALSALIQHSADAQLAFLQAGGLEALHATISSDEAGGRLKARTLFVLRSLLIESEPARVASLKDERLAAELAVLSLQGNCEEKGKGEVTGEVLANEPGRHECSHHAAAALLALAAHDTLAVKASLKAQGIAVSFPQELLLLLRKLEAGTKYTHTTIHILILPHVSSYMCPRAVIFVPSYYCICVLLLLFPPLQPRSRYLFVSSYVQHVSLYYCICVWRY